MVASVGAWLVLKDCHDDVDPMCKRMRSFACLVFLARAARLWPRLVASARGAGRALGWHGSNIFGRGGDELHTDAVDFDLHGLDSDDTDEEGQGEGGEKGGMLGGKGGARAGYGSTPTVQKEGGVVVEWHHPLYAKFQLQTAGGHGYAGGQPPNLEI